MNPLSRALASGSILAACVLAAAEARAAGGGENLGRTVEKARLGYAVRILEDWTEIPLPPGEEKLVGRFTADGNGPSAGARLDIVRWSLEAAAPKPEAKGKPGDSANPAGSSEKPPQPPGLVGLIRSNDADPGKGKPLDAANGAKGIYYEFASPKGKSFAVAFRNERYEYGLVYSAPPRSYDKSYRAAFLRSAKTFRFIPISDDTHGPSASSIPGVSNRDALQQAKHRLIEGIPDWYVMDTENYVILSNSPDKDLVRTIASQIEKIRDLYIELFPPAHRVDAVSVVRVCASLKDYLTYGGPLGTAGYWNDDNEELVFFDRTPNQSKRRSNRNSLSVLYHEAFHQYIYYAVGQVAPHSWYNEGHGDYFAGALPSGDRYSIQPFEWRVPVVKRAEAENKLVPLRQFVGYTQAEYYKNAKQNYAQGWAFIYFLRKVTRNSRWNRIPEIYFDYLKSHLDPQLTGTQSLPRPGPETKTGGAPPPTDGAAPVPKEGDGSDDDEELPPPPPPSQHGTADEAAQHDKVLKAAVEKAFDGIDWDALDKEFRAFIRRL